MKMTRPKFPAPHNAAELRAVRPVICYPTELLVAANFAQLKLLRASAQLTETITVAPRDAQCVSVSAGSFFRIVCPEGPQVGDLNVWQADDFSEHFYSGKTRALHGTHLSTGDRLWSRFPNMRPLATITEDTLDWYDFDDFGGSVHDVIGTRCDPYTGRLLNGTDYHFCCHSNLTRAFSDFSGLPLFEAEQLVHDVLNVFMCTGFTRDTGQYFMKASPVRQGDYLEFYAELDLVVALSACPGGDCSQQHSSDVATCHPLLIEIFAPDASVDRPPAPASSIYDRSHGR
jgi:hypothetical protein